MLITEKLPSTYQGSTKNKQFNTSALTVWAQQGYFYLEPNYSKCLIPTVLKIDRKMHTISQIKSQAFQAPKTATPYYFSFFLGIINLNGKKLMMLSDSVQIVCAINSRDVFRITKPLFLFYNPQDKKNLTDEQARILINLVVIFEQGMYFSYAYNLTQPLHHIKKLENSMISNAFNWAQAFQNELAHCNSMWSLPVIQGFVNKIQLYINAHKLKIVLISRRSIHHGGPWQYSTGLSEMGYSANYVETQQIFFVNNFIFSFVQVRGSVPIYWSQKFSYGMASNAIMQRNAEQNFNGFRKHLGNMLINRQYESIVLVNLLNKESAAEKRLIQNYEYIIRKTEKQKSIILQQVESKKKPLGLHYYYYDLHNKCPSKNYKIVNKFITQQLKKVLLSSGFTAVRMQDDKNFEILYNQKGVIRTNCGTCIDRTNIVQSRLAAHQLVYILEHINLKINSFDDRLDFVDGSDAFATLYRNLWADNGDAVSKQYTGTGSTESYAIRKGKLSYMTTIDHGMTSLVRAFRNIRQEDEEKYKTILFLLKNFKSNSSQKSAMLEKKQKVNEKQQSVQKQKQKETSSPSSTKIQQNNQTSQKNTTSQSQLQHKVVTEKNN